MLTDEELQDLARTVANLPPEHERIGIDAVAAIRDARARQEQERIADLRSMTDLQVAVLMDVQGLRREAALTLLRDAGFVRGAVLEKAYREGYHRGALDVHAGPGAVPALPDEGDPDYVTMRGYDLADLMKGA
ncbi:hypothetical protein LOK46_14480 [Methylobacterium sp. NMS14P]|uniref:hypothetical protein n=1 Tax=Methylobacterium sp. NMS14P TaxID=2894310 RepID=UPI00235838F2|nr:hypothetical protein [Methylobacterium sp. NMS14P]WCS27979.1 hypothetical protein LOK46_14480 [Methylobacterium sp. NMS14P]